MKVLFMYGEVEIPDWLYQIMEFECEQQGVKLIGELGIMFDWGQSRLGHSYWKKLDESDLNELNLIKDMELPKDIMDRYPEVFAEQIALGKFLNKA